MQTLAVPVRISLSNILLTTDFSKVSKSALPYATSLAQRHGAKLFLVHVVPPEPYLAMPMEPAPPLQADVLWNSARRDLAEFLPAGVATNLAHEEILRRGEIWTTLSDIIHQQAIDLVVIGTHGRQGFREVVMGSVAEKIYRQAICPVLTIGPEAAAAGETQWQPKRILFPTDFSETSLHALPYALSFAEEHEGTLTLLHMIPLTPWQYQEALEQSIRERLNQLVPAEVRCKLEFVVGFEFPADAVLRAAGNGQADLVVMGVNKRSATVSAHLPWSTASHVVGQAPCPVLTVRG